MNTLALVLFGQGDVAEAWQLQEKLLEVHQRLHGPDHPETLISMNNLAKQSLLAQGEYTRTIPLRTGARRLAPTRWTGSSLHAHQHEQSGGSPPCSR